MQCLGLELASIASRQLIGMCFANHGLEHEAFGTFSVYQCPSHRGSLLLGSVLGPIRLAWPLQTYAPQHVARLGGGDERVRILLEKKALTHELPGGAPDSSNEPAVIAIAFLDRQPGVASR